MGEIFLVLGCLLGPLSLGLYFRQVWVGQSVPNPTTWLLWAVVGLMNAVSFFLTVEGSLWKSAHVILVSFGLVTIFVYSAVRGRFGRPGLTDLLCLLLAVLAEVVWQTTGSAAWANLSLQLVFVVSFVPTIHGLLTGKLRERLPAWAIAALSYVFMALGLLLTGPVTWIALVFPIVNGVLGNGSVAVLIVVLNRRKGADS